MAGQKKVLSTTFVADVAVTRYAALVAGTEDGHATYATADNTGTFVGIADEDQNAGYATLVVSMGNQWATAGGAIAYGDPVMVGAAGVVKTAKGVSDAVVIGYALETAAEAGDLILIKLA
ncbi:capsid cement protein [Alicyclobacillus acidoterrestris]|uniref:capsid cement protein n=1 Tax=Alicyclobacillus acidoterrestris TaxID=1450 RepID=UPI003F529EED